MLSTTPLIEIHDSLDVPVTPALIPTAAVPASLPSTVIPKAIKFLLPHAQAGAIIGKSGSGIHAIQSCDGIWLKLGGPADYFPGTNERVLFLAGSNAGFVAAVDMILRRLHADASSKSPMFPPEVVDLSVKLLIPDVCVGRIIGRSGERVQSLRASSGAHIWCTPKPAPETPAAPERPLHINGKLHQVIAAVFGVMDALHAEPASVVYTHASVVYALPQAAPSAASAPPSFPGSSASIGSPLSSVSSAPGLFDANPSRFGQAARRASRPPALSGGSSCPSSPVPDEATDSTASVQSASSTSEKILASTLAARSRTPSRASSSSVDAVDSPAAGDLATKWASPRRLRKRAPLSPSYLMPASPHGFAYMYPPGPMMSPQFAPWMFAQQPFHWLPSTPAPAAHPCPISACPRCESACQCISDTFTIPEAVAGVVLGKGGSTLRWMQVHTSCSILLSARGDPCFGASGTRVVTITGSSANVPNAKRILLERVSAEVAAFRGASPPILAVPTPTVDS